MPEPNHRLRAARERTPSRRTPGGSMSREELAEAVALWIVQHDAKGRDVAFDAGHLGKLERGVVRRPRAHYVAALCAVLGATEAELGLAHADPITDTLSACELPLVEPWELADVLTRSNMSMIALDHFERAALGCAERYPCTPPGTLITLVSGQMKRLNEALQQAQPIRVRQRCVALLGLLSGLAGNLWIDLGQTERAARFFEVGELAGQESEDQDLLAWVLATRSIGPFFAGDPTQALDLLARADAATQARSSDRRRAWIAALRARAAAAAGDRDQSLSALDRAYRHIDEATEPAVGTDFFDAPRLEGIAGSTYLFAGDSDRAAPLLFRALEKRSPQDAKGRALLMLELARCHIGVKEPEQAVRLAMAALQAANGTLVGPIVARVEAVRAELGHWSDVHLVLELDERLSELANGA